MPGVNVTTAVRTGPVGTGDIVAGQLFVVGQTERGPANEPTLIRSFSEYITVYGKYRADSLYPHVKTFFDEGGTRCYVSRAVGASLSAAGSTVLLDSDDNPALELTATSAGSWSQNLDVSVLLADGDTGFRLSFFLDGVLINTTRDLVDTADAVSYINSLQDTILVTASDDGLSGNDPKIVTRQSLSNGNDGSSVDNFYTETIAALSSFNKTLGPGAVAMPGKFGSTVWSALLDHAVSTDRIALCGFNPASVADEVKSPAAAYAGDPNGSRMAFYFPHVKVAAPTADEIAEGTNAVSASTLTISPEVYAAAARSRAVQAVGGPWRAGAGQISSARTLQGLAQDLTPAAADLLDNARINAIRVVGNDIRVYGARSASNDEANWRFITFRDTLNYIVHGVEGRLEEFLFETIDGRNNLFANMRSSIKAFLEPIRVAGGLYEAYDVNGALVDPGYSVTVDSNVNPATQLATGLVKAQVGVRISSVADQIQVTITKSNLTAPV